LPRLDSDDELAAVSVEAADSPGRRLRSKSNLSSSTRACATARSAVCATARRR